MLEPITLLLADEQRLLRDGIRMLLESEEDLTIVGEAADGEEVVDAYIAVRPDVVLMDVQMPKVNGVAAIRRILVEDPQAKVIILTTHDDDEYVFEGMRAGALGYLLKTMPGDELASAVRTVHLGGALLEPTIARKVLSALGSPHSFAGPGPAEQVSRREEDRTEPLDRRSGTEEASAEPVDRRSRTDEESDLDELLRMDEPADAGPAEPLNRREQANAGPAEPLNRREQANARLAEPLSRREREVLLLIGEGLSNRKIANRLNLAEGTIKNYVSSLIGKLNVQDRTQAALLSRELGLL